MQALTRMHLTSMSHHILAHLQMMQEAMNVIASITEDNQEQWKAKNVNQYFDKLTYQWDEIRAVIRDMSPRLQQLQAQDGDIQELSQFAALLAGVKVYVRVIPEHEAIANTSIETYDSSNLPGFMLQLRELIEDRDFVKMGVQFAQRRYIIRTQLEEEGH